MTLIGLTGALMGVAASVAGRIGKRAEDRRLAQLENTVNLLESRLRVSESLVDHWRSEARRLVHERVREQAWIEAQSFAQAAAQCQALQAYQQQANPLQQAAMNAQAAMQAQHYAAMLPSDLGQGQLGQQQMGLAQAQMGLAQPGMPHSAAALQQEMFSIIRNCSPGRARLLGGTHGLLERLDPGEA